MQRRVICEHEIMLKGVSPKSLIDIVPTDKICQSVLGTLGEWCFPLLDPPWSA
jgi:hypothetical protein